ETRFEKWMANLEVQAAVDPRKKYPNEMLQELAKKSFIEFDFINSSERAKHSQMNVSIPILNPTDQSYWEELPASTGSSCSQDESGCFVCNSGYSHCVHDVAVGKFDLCVADMWITPCRSAIVQFLPPVRFDMFYLVQAAKPRTEGGWAILLSSNRVSCKIAGWGFAFGMLVLTSTYTANLTDILALERMRVTSLQRLEDAKDMSICVDEEALSHFTQTYHTLLENVTWRPVKNSRDIPQLLHDANCGAAVMYQAAIDRMHAGEFAGDGRPWDYDCKIRK
ncbi:unnamed protein product, partial [Symbiodinium necroappetens]